VPYRPKHPCRHPGCGELTDGRYCLKHKADYDALRGSANQRGYGADWQRVRSLVIRAHPFCRQCGMPATEVDHIIAIRDGGARLDPANLQSLCHSCHMQKTADRRGGRPD